MAAVELVGLAELVDRLGTTRLTVDSWRARGRLPEPEYVVGGRPAWRWSTIKRWAERSGRLPGPCKCGAGAGEPCRTPSGAERSTPHANRPKVAA